MMNTIRNRAQIYSAPAIRILLVCSLALAIAACGKDSDDGDVVDSIALPLGELALNLKCENFGLHTETCALDDSDNPFATAGVNWSDSDAKFAFYNGIVAELELIYGSPIPVGILEKTTVYFWATAQAKAPNGENQWQVAQALYLLANQSCSQLIQDQALRAYRSTLDNYFTDVTFFATDDFPFPPVWENVFYPFPVKILAANQMRIGVGTAAAACGATGYIPYMFDPIGGADGDRNDFLARVQLNEWGYIYEPSAGNVIEK